MWAVRHVKRERKEREKERRLGGEGHGDGAMVAKIKADVNGRNEKVQNGRLRNHQISFFKAFLTLFLASLFIVLPLHHYQT